MVDNGKKEMWCVWLPKHKSEFFKKAIDFLYSEKIIKRRTKYALMTFMFDKMESAILRLVEEKKKKKRAEAGR